MADDGVWFRDRDNHGDTAAGAGDEDEVAMQFRTLQIDEEGDDSTHPRHMIPTQ